MVVQFPELQEMLGDLLVVAEEEDYIHLQYTITEDLLMDQ
jgi:hypothetical protein